MPAFLQRPIIIKSADASGDGILQMQVFNPRERMIRALKIWGLMWLGAACFLPIPIAHLVMVPGLLVAGPVMAYRRYRIAEAADNVSGICPVNKEEMTIPLDAPDRLPLWKYCPSCNASLQLLEKDGAGPPG